MTPTGTIMLNCRGVPMTLIALHSRFGRDRDRAEALSQRLLHILSGDETAEHEHRN